MFLRPALMRSLARFNQRITNPAFRVVASRILGYANVIHTGRKTGRQYRTPVGITWHGETELQIAVNYGMSSDWVLNVLAADELTIEYQGRKITLTEPRIIEEHGQHLLRATRPH